MKRIKRVFLRVHIVLWTLFGLLAALQLSQSNANWRELTLGFILTCLSVFYGHFALLTRYSGKKKDASYFGSLFAILLAAPLFYLFFQEQSPGNPNSYWEQY